MEKVVVIEVVLRGGEKRQFFLRAVWLGMKSLQDSSEGRQIAAAMCRASSIDMGVVEVTTEELSDLENGRAYVVLSSLGHKIIKRPPSW